MRGFRLDDQQFLGVTFEFFWLEVVLSCGVDGCADSEGGGVEVAEAAVGLGRAVEPYLFLVFLHPNITKESCI